MRRIGLRYEYVVAIVFVTGLFMEILDTTIVNVALPTLAREFGVGTSDVEWVVIAYLLSLAVWIPASGWIGDRFGTKRTFLFAIAVFTVASALCGQALGPVGAGGVPRPAGCRRRDDDPGRDGHAVPRLRARAAGEGLDRPDHPDRHGPGARAGARRPPGDRVLVALGVLRQRPARHRGVRVRCSWRCGSTASRRPVRSTSPGSCSVRSGWPPSSTRCRRDRSKGGVSPQIVIAGVGGLLAFALLTRIELRKTHPMLALRLLRDRMFRNANLCVGAVVLQLRRRPVPHAAVPAGAPRAHRPRVRPHDVPAGHRRADLLADRRPAVPVRRTPSPHGVRPRRARRARR